MMVSNHGGSHVSLAQIDQQQSNQRSAAKPVAIPVSAYLLVGKKPEDIPGERITCIHSAESNVPHLVQRACSITDKNQAPILRYQLRFICETCIKDFEKKNQSPGYTYMDAPGVQQRMFDPAVVYDPETGNQVIYKEIKDRANSFVDEFEKLKIENEQLQQELKAMQGKYEESGNLVAAQKIHIEQLEENNLSPAKSDTNVTRVKFDNVKEIFDLAKIDENRKLVIRYLESKEHKAPGGYSVRLRVYPYGDGMGEGRYVSVFMQIMNKNVDQASWPFNKKVKFEAIQKGVVIAADGFRSELTSNSFTKPKDGKDNIPAGCPKFISHSKVVAGEPLFIRVTYRDK